MKKLVSVCLLVAMLMVSVGLPVLANESVAITPEKALNCYTETLRAAKAPNGFTNYKGHFYIDFDNNLIPELVMVYADASNWDYCAVFYYCNLSFDFTNGLDHSTPIYRAAGIYECPETGYGTDILATSIGGSGGTDAGIYRLEDGQYGIGIESFGGAGSEKKLYCYGGPEFFDSYYGAGEEIWNLRQQVPGEFEFYTVPNPKNPFNDVSKDDYFYDAVVWANENGITSGTSVRTFSPEATCTRGQVVTFLYRLSGRPSVKGSNPFTDVDDSDYYYDAVIWAVRNGITSGTSGTTFSPEATCTSAQVITFLHRAKGKPVPATVNGRYEGAYYQNAAIWAEENRLFEGLSTAFSPDREATRAEIVTYMYRDSFIEVENGYVTELVISYRP
ncbi:MAG: S-layer homology domain-containing protein [Ruminococcaceae bacterium]|nr:S-layer homology domain-containing protein [Oscillospiraceae bacterium]